MLQRSRFNTPELLEALRKRNPDAWRALYEEQWRGLCAFIRMRLCGSSNRQADSEDLAQEVLCRAYTSIGRFRGEAHLETWLHTIAQHVIIDEVRANFRKRCLREDNNALKRVGDILYAQAVPNPETFVLGQDLLQQLLREVNAILGQRSRLFVKRHLEDLSEQEVAAAEGLKCGTASGYLAKSRRLLRQRGAQLASILRGEGEAVAGLSTEVEPNCDG